MKNHTTINPSRIAWCCAQTRIDFAHLAKVVKASPEALQKGDLSREQLERMADYFGYTPLFFLEEGHPPQNALHSVVFKTVASQQEISLNPSLLKIINLAQRHRDFYANHIGKSGKPASFAPPALSGSAENRALQTRKWLELRDDVPYGFDDYRRLVEKKGILVVRSQGYRGKWQIDHPKVVGFYMPDERVPLIFVKKTTPQMQTLTLFHELGHLLLHGGRGYIDGEEALHGGISVKKEREANRFADRCLVSDVALGKAEARIPKSAGEFDRAFRPIARRLGVSVEVVARVLFEQGKIGERQHIQYGKLAQKRRGEDKSPQARRAPKSRRYREPLEIFGEGFVRTILDGMSGGDITLNKACGHLGGVQLSDVMVLKERFGR